MNIASFAPHIIIVLLVVVGLRLKPSLRNLWMWTALPALACGLLDALQLLLLPALRLSFGPASLPLFFFTFSRLALLLPALALLFLRRDRQSKAVPVLSGIIQAVLLVLAFWGLYVEPFRLTVTTLQPDSPQFFTDRPLRILHLSDLHMEHPTRREADVLARIEKLQPDLILLTGDYVNPSYVDDALTLAETRDFLAQLHTPYGVYAVNGTVDDNAHMVALFDGLDNIRILADGFEVEQWPGGELALVGVTNTYDRSRDGQALTTLMAQVPPDAYVVLLYHTPDLIDTASAAGVDLYLAGHTHGGQIRLPFYGALATFSAYGKQYEMGEYRLDSTMLYVSRGLGMEGWEMPRMRFLCPPEMEVIEFGN